MSNYINVLILVIIFLFKGNEDCKILPRTFVDKPSLQGEKSIVNVNYAQLLKFPRENLAYFFKKKSPFQFYSKCIHTHTYIYSKLDFYNQNHWWFFIVFNPVHYNAEKYLCEFYDKFWSTNDGKKKRKKCSQSANI